MSKLEIIDRGILYINPDPARKHVFASHPHPLQLSTQEYICTYQRGAAPLAPDLNVALLRSLDGGASWCEEGFLYDKSADDRVYSVQNGFLSQMSDGTLVVLTFRVDLSLGQRMFTPEGRLIEIESVLLFSGDEGHTWSESLPLRSPQGMVVTPANPVLELEDGRWMATFDQWAGPTDPLPCPPRMWALFSTDRGQSWGELTMLADGRPDGRGLWHGKTIRLADGRLYTTLQTADMTDPERGRSDLPLHYTYADPTGRHWSKPEPTTVPAQTHWPALLPDGRLALIYTWRKAEHPGFIVVLSEDEGRTWDLENQVRVWDATGWTHIGIAVADKWPHSHDTIAFGAPALMTTLEGDLLASWWCTYASLTHIRWARLRVSD